MVKHFIKMAIGMLLHSCAVLFLLISADVFAQTKVGLLPQDGRADGLLLHTYTPGDSIVYFYKRGTTKTYTTTKVPLYHVTTGTIIKTPKEAKPITKTPLLTIHGNVMYNLDYRSNIDTPYAEKEIYQHTIQTYLDVTIKDKYPMRVYFNTAYSNSNWFKNFTDINLGFDQNQFRNKMQQLALQKLKSFSYNDSLNAYKQKLASLQTEINSLKKSFPTTSHLQAEVERRERALYGNAKDYAGSVDFMKDNQMLPIGKTLSDTSNVLKQYLARANDLEEKFKRSKTIENTESKVKDLQHRTDSLSEKLTAYKQKTDSLTKKAQQYEEALQELYAGTLTSKALKEKLETLSIPDTVLPKGYKTLMDIKSFSVGRTIVNYSELSAKNISISGVQAEYNPSYYLAVACGTVDYRFRNFIVSHKAPKQYLNILRAGLGNKEGNNVILTWYGGRREMYNTYTSAADTTKIPNSRLMGFTLEGNFKIIEGTYATAEIARSSLPYYSRSAQKPEVFNSAINLGDNNNTAYSLKVNSYIEKTKTRLTAYYKHYGANFQSFSMFTTGATQSAWQVKADQSLFKKRLSLTASIKQNEYTNPFMDSYNQTNTIFKSIQATLRVPKYPTVMVGYYPSSQLTKLGDNYYAENLFYNLVANVNHLYTIGGLSHNTNIMYTQFYNKAQDSSFVYFNTKNLLVTQSIFWNKLTVNVNASAATNTDYNIYMLGTDAQWHLNKILSLGCGIKYNKQTVYNLVQMGYNGNATIKLPKVGEFQLMMDKGFVPGSNKQLVENNIGRFNFLKTF